MKIDKKKLPPMLNKEAYEDVEKITYNLWNSYADLYYARARLEKRFGYLYDDNLKELKEISDKLEEYYNQFLEIMIEERRKQLGV